jgi:hypothetical protein
MAYADDVVITERTLQDVKEAFTSNKLWNFVQTDGRTVYKQMLLYTEFKTGKRSQITEFTRRVLSGGEGLQWTDAI